MTEMKICECIDNEGACTAGFREHMCKVRNVNELDDYEPPPYSPLVVTEELVSDAEGIASNARMIRS